MMTKLFKSTATIFALALIVAFSVSAEPLSEQRSHIEILINSEEEAAERSLPYVLEADLLTSSKTIEIRTCNLGVAYIYIIDTLGQIVDVCVINSGVEPVVLIDAPTMPGQYYLVISSSVCYGEGVFYIN